MWRAILVCVILVSALASCTRDTAIYSPCPACPLNISFKSAIIPIFQAHCATPGCHDAATDAFSLNLDSAHAYLGATEAGTGNVTPYNANYSLLYTILLGTGTNHMPLDAPSLDPCDIQKIACWINQGAHDN